MTITFSLLLCFLVIWFLLKPHLSFATNSSILPEDINVNALYDEKNRHLQVLHDLELDYATSKISADDYEQSREAIMVELGDVLKVIDKLE